MDYEFYYSLVRTNLRHWSPDYGYTRFGKVSWVVYRLWHLRSSL
jgi:hypothetical protein